MGRQFFESLGGWDGGGPWLGGSGGLSLVVVMVGSFYVVVFHRGAPPPLVRARFLCDFNSFGVGQFGLLSQKKKRKKRKKVTTSGRFKFSRNDIIRANDYGIPAPRIHVLHVHKSYCMIASPV